MSAITSERERAIAAGALGQSPARWDSHDFYGLTCSEWSSAKQASRDLVAKHFIEHATPDVLTEGGSVYHLADGEPPRQLMTSRCMVLPGAGWLFEQRFEELAGWAPQWLGIESEWGVLEYGLRFMPRKDSCRVMRNYLDTDIGRLEGFKTRSAAQVFRASVSTVVRAIRGHEADRVRRRIGNWTSFWFDGFGTMNTTVDELAGLGSCLAEGRKVVPFAVTMFCGRESGPIADMVASAPGDAGERRAEVLSMFLSRGTGRECLVDQVIRYGSMVLVCGRLVAGGAQ